MMKDSFSRLGGDLGNALSNPLVIVVVAVALALLPLCGVDSLLIRAIDILVFALLVVSLNVLVGYAGMVSMGHAAFFAAGGYTAGLLAKYLGLPMILAFPLGPIAAALLALVIGFFSIRLTHAYFIMLTLAFGQLVYTIIWKASGITGGDDGLIGFGPADALTGTVPYYYFTCIVVGISLAILFLVCRSPFGRALTAIRDNPERTTFIGINVRATQLTAFIISGFFAGTAGAIQAYFNRGMFTESAHFILAADALVVVMLGGARHFMGPIIGAVVFKMLTITIPTFTAYWPFFLGLVILAVAIWMPGGLASLGLRPGRSERSAAHD